MRRDDRDSERIEVAIARFYPDLDAVARSTGASPREIAMALVHLERMNGGSKVKRGRKPKQQVA